MTVTGLSILNLKKGCRSKSEELYCILFKNMIYLTWMHGYIFFRALHDPLEILWITFVFILENCELRDEEEKTDAIIVCWNILNFYILEAFIVTSILTDLLAIISATPLRQCHGNGFSCSALVQPVDINSSCPFLTSIQPRYVFSHTNVRDLTDDSRDCYWLVSRPIRVIDYYRMQNF